MKIKNISIIVFVLLFSSFIYAASILQDINENLALDATATASSEYNGYYLAENVNDGIISIWDTGEWASLHGGAGEYIQLLWGSGQTMNEIWIYSRPNPYDRVYDSNLEIYQHNDSTPDYIINTGMLPDGGAPKILYLTPEQQSLSIRKIIFRVIGVSSNNQNTGLAEIACYNTGADVTITGGAIDGATIGGTTPAAATFSTLNINNKYTLPTVDGNTSGKVLTTNGSGTVTWESVSGGANTALSNLASVQVNTDLIPNSDGDHNLGAGGTSSYDWNDIFFDGVLYLNNSRYIHNTGTTSFFAGVSAGNLTNTGTNNVSIGYEAMPLLTSGTDNIAIGYRALGGNTSGSQKIAIGTEALNAYNGTSPTGNIGIGYHAGNAWYGSNSIFLGNYCGQIAGSGAIENTAIGYYAMDGRGYSDGAYNTALGAYAFQVHRSGNYNTIIGHSAGILTDHGSSNTFIGASAGDTNTSGTDNTFVGYNADATTATLTYATAIGSGATVADNYSLILGRVDGTNPTRVGIGTTTPNSKAALDVTSTTMGFLPPRMTTEQRDAITSPPDGLMIYNTTTHKINFYNGSAWEAVTSAT
jgi:hypothetical protein